MNIFKYLDYREIIKKLVLSRRSLEKSFNFQALSEHMGVQRSYLSQVLNGKAELNADQMYLALEFLGLKDEEANYLRLLLEYSRSGLKKRKDQLKKEIETIRKTKLKSEKYLEVEVTPVSGQSMHEYYYDSYNQLIHVCLSNEDFKRDPFQFCLELGLTEERLGAILQELNRLGIINVDEKKISVNKTNLHLPRDSKVFPIYRAQMRQMALNRSQQLTDPEDSYNFSVLFSAEPKTRSEVQELFFEFLNQAQKLTQEDKPKQVYQMNFDLLKWL